MRALAVAPGRDASTRPPTVAGGAKVTAPAALACALGFALAGCGDAHPRVETFEVADSAGVTVARNLAPPADTLRLAEPAARIGEVDGPPEYLFELISDVVPLPGGRMAVVDNRGARVAIFDSAGRWVREVGGRGDGPGEYRTPLRAWLEDGDLLVHDVVPRRLLRFTSEGAFLASSSVAVGPNALPAPLRQYGSGWVDEREWGHGPQPGPAMAALVRISDEGEVSDTLLGPYAIPRIGWETDATGWGRMVNPPTFSAVPSWTIGAELLYWTPGDRHRIEARRSDGSLARVILLPGEEGRVEETDRTAWRRAVHERFGVPLTALEGEEFAAWRPAITGLMVDDGGRLWAAEHDPVSLRGEPGSSWRILSPDGRLLRLAVFPRGFRLMRVAEGRAYGVARDALGVEFVAVFALSEDA